MASRRPGPPTPRRCRGQDAEQHLDVGVPAVDTPERGHGGGWVPLVFNQVCHQGDAKHASGSEIAGHTVGHIDLISSTYDYQTKLRPSRW
jgi:hypothetical protein